MKPLTRSSWTAPVITATALSSAQQSPTNQVVDGQTTTNGQLVNTLGS